MLVNKSKSIREAQENVEAFCNYEATAWWPKIYNIFE